MGLIDFVLCCLLPSSIHPLDEPQSAVRSVVEWLVENDYFLLNLIVKRRAATNTPSIDNLSLATKDSPPSQRDSASGAE